MFKRGTTLNKEEKEKLEDAYKKMRDECIYEYIDNYLQSQNVSLGSIYIAPPGWMGLAGVTNSGDLKFADSDEITPEALKHEWFHLFQMEYHGMSSFEELGMMEWEQALFQDILVFIEVKGKRDPEDHIWACASMSKGNYREEYLDWLSTLTNKGKSFPNKIDNSNFEHFAEVFGDVSISYNVRNGYNYSNTSYTTSAIQSAFVAAQKYCN